MITDTLRFLFPSSASAWELVDDDARGPRIAKWNLPDPQPTPEQLEKIEASPEFQAWLAAREKAAKVAEIKQAAAVEITAKYPITAQINAIAESLEAIARATGLLEKIDALPISEEQKAVIIAGLQMKSEIKKIREASDEAEKKL